jgi:hypothetical protein
VANPLTVGTEEELGAAIRFLLGEYLPGAEIHRRLSAQHGNSGLLQ